MKNPDLSMYENDRKINIDIAVSIIEDPISYSTLTHFEVFLG